MHAYNKLHCLCDDDVRRKYIYILRNNSRIRIKINIGKKEKFSLNFIFNIIFHHIVFEAFLLLLNLETESSSSCWHFKWIQLLWKAMKSRVMKRVKIWQWIWLERVFLNSQKNTKNFFKYFILNSPDTNNSAISIFSFSSNEQKKQFKSFIFISQVFLYNTKPTQWDTKLSQRV
jgi:hypothetical protein